MILKYATNNVPFYFFLKNKKKLTLADFPIINKKLIKDNFKIFSSNNISNMIYWKSYTGGSTGEPFMFLNSSSVDYLFQNRLWKRMGYKKDDLILAMDGSGIEKSLIEKNIYWIKKSNKSLPYGKFSLSSLYLTKENIDVYVDYIFKIKPKFIRGYPSFINTISLYLLEKKKKLNFQIKGIQLTSETVYPNQVINISNALSNNIYVQYGHTENCAFAYTNDLEKDFIIEPLYGYIELITKDGNIAKEGEIGEIVVTSLHNYVMPLIRYRTGDLAIATSSKFKIKKLIGRTQDYFIGRDGSKIILTALIFAQHFSALQNIDRWHFIQDKKGFVDVYIVKGKNYSLKDEKEIFELFDSKGKVLSNFIYVEKIQVKNNGKSILINQKIDI